MLNIKFQKLRKRGIIRNENGFTLIEVLISIAFMMVVVGGIIMAISTSSKILVIANNKEIAKDIAAGDMEWIKSQPYADSYTLPMAPPIYSAYVVTDGDPTHVNTIVADFLEHKEQRIQISISLNGNALFTLIDYRADY